MRGILSLALFLFLGGMAPGASSRLSTLVEREIDELERTYQHLHSHPELSYHEKQTSAFIADALRNRGFSVTTSVGKYSVEDRVSYGVVGILENGSGPTILVRTDMDALPVIESTGMPYASEVTIRTESGVETGVMHACGHDIHMTCFLGTARLLADLKEEWRGTLVLIAQPAEERGAGAKAMLDDGLYTRFPKPDYALALHVSPFLVAGKVGYCLEYALANVDSVDITVRGRGGHGASPHATKDPVVLAAQIVLALQTISSREVSPLKPVVVTVGSIHGGTKHNIIPDFVHLQLTVRSYQSEVREQVLESIRRIAINSALAAGIPEELLPVVKLDESEFTPAMYNDPGLTEQMVRVFGEELGRKQVVAADPAMGGEDFSRYSLDGSQIPSLLFWLGTADPEKAEASRVADNPLPALHSSAFAPLPKPTITTGVRVMTAAVLDLMDGAN